MISIYFTSDVIWFDLPQNECDVFSNKDDPNLPQQLPDEKCSINEEVVLMQEMRTCSSEEQASLALLHGVPKVLTFNAIVSSRFDDWMW